MKAIILLTIVYILGAFSGYLYTKEPHKEPIKQETIVKKQDRIVTEKVPIPKERPKASSDKVRTDQKPKKSNTQRENSEGN